MERVKRIGKKLILLLALLSVVLLHCTTNQAVEPEEQSIQLYLYANNTFEADFTGALIPAIIEVKDSVTFRELSFYTNGVFFRPNISPDEKFITIEVPMHWNIRSLNLPFDSTHMAPYDSVIVRIGPDVSNAVKVYVTNRAPIIDSIQIADTSIKVHENIYSNNMYELKIDTIGKIDMQITARDWDNYQTLKAYWRPLKDTTLITISEDKMKATYNVPLYNFRDSIIIRVYDTKAGDVEIVLILVKTSGVDPIKVTRLVFGDSVFTDTTSTYTVKQVAYDTVATEIAYLSADEITIGWSAAKGLMVNRDGTTPAIRDKAFYISSDNTDTLTTDTVITIDTIIVTLRNKVGDLTQKTIILQKIPANLRPVIDSVLIDTITFKGSYNDSTGYPYTIFAQKTVPLKVFARDPDRKGERAVTYTWDPSAILGIISDSTGPSITYTAPDSSTIDILYFSAIDPLNFKTTRKIALTVFKNSPPRIDTFYLGDTTLVPSVNDTTVSVTLSSPDTFAIRPAVYDKDIALVNDSLKYVWNYRTVNLTPAVATTKTFIYTSADMSYYDTITVRVTDKFNATTTRRIFAAFIKSQ